MLAVYQGLSLGDIICAKFVWRHWAMLDAAGRVYGHQHDASFGELAFACASQANCKSKMDAVEAAFYTPYGDLLVLNDDGTNTTNCVASAGTLQGVRPMSLTWDDRPGAQFTTWRSYSASFSWETRLAGLPAGFLLEYSESVTVQGGTPLKIVREPINVLTSVADEFVVIPKQKYVVTQRGRAVGLSSYPAGLVGIPLYPNPNSNPITTTSPMKIGLGSEKYGYEWSYSWEFGDLASLPIANVWP